MKIILFLSAIYSPSRGECEYEYENSGKFYNGEFTNDAPIRFLLDEYKEVNEIIVILTKQAEETSFENFKKVVKGEKNVKITPVHYDIAEDFRENTLKEILDKIKENDEILIDATGGLRNDIIHLLLISQVLTYKKIPIKTVIYSNIQDEKIRKLDNTIDLFKVITAMEVFITTGNTSTLRKYYPKPYSNQKIEDIITALENLYDIISLCLVGQISSALDNLNQALKYFDDVNEDILFSQLVTIFKDKYGEKMDLVDLIDWCTENSMIQQALTIYNELIPRYLFENKIIEFSGTIKKINKVDITDEYVNLIDKEFFVLGNKYNELQDFKDILIKDKSAVIDYIMMYNYEKLNYSSEQIAKIDTLGNIFDVFYKYSRQDTIMRASRLKTKNEQALFKEICQKLNKDDTIVEKLKTAKKGEHCNRLIELVRGMDFEILANGFGVPMQNDKVETIKNLDKIIENNKEYALNCEKEAFKNICRDYLYIKSLRNRTNHASDSKSDEAIMEYLKDFGFKNIEDIKTVDEVLNILKNATKNIREAKK